MGINLTLETATLLPASNNRGVIDRYVTSEPDAIKNELALHVGQGIPFVYMTISLSRPAGGESDEWFFAADDKLKYLSGALAYSRARDAWAFQVASGQYHFIVRGGLGEAQKLAEELFEELPQKDDSGSSRGIVIAMQHNPDPSAERTRQNLADMTMRLVTGVTTAYTRALKDTEKYRRVA